jgi:preprotein translocase SecE subunit
MPNEKTIKNPISQITEYFKDVIKEAKLVSWPTFNYAVVQFSVVVLLSSALTGLLYLIDLGILGTINKFKELILK